MAIRVFGTFEEVEANPTEALAIEAALAAVNGAAIRYTVRTAHRVSRVARFAEALLDGVSLEERVGARVTFRPEVWSKNFYSKSSSISTAVHLRREIDGWYFVGAERAKAGPKDRERFDVILADDIKPPAQASGSASA